MTHDFKAALDRLPLLSQANMIEHHTFHDNLSEDLHSAIKTALRIADKLMQEPSEKAYEAAAMIPYMGDTRLDDGLVFKAMLEQMIKEATANDTTN